MKASWSVWSVLSLGLGALNLKALLCNHPALYTKPGKAGLQAPARDLAKSPVGARHLHKAFTSGYRFCSPYQDKACGNNLLARGLMRCFAVCGLVHFHGKFENFDWYLPVCGPWVILPTISVAFL